VIAVGGSQGSSVALATAARPDHDLDAVVALSGGWPHEFYTGPDASRDPVALARRIDVPVLYVSALGDVAVPQQASRALYRVTARQGTDYIALKGSGHAMSLLGYFERSQFFKTTSSTSSERIRPGDEASFLGCARREQWVGEM